MKRPGLVQNIDPQAELRDPSSAGVGEKRLWLTGQPKYRIHIL